MSRRHLQTSPQNRRPLCGSSSSRVYEFEMAWEWLKHHACSKCVEARKVQRVDASLGEPDALLADLETNIKSIASKVLTGSIASSSDLTDALRPAMQAYAKAHKS